MAQHAEKWAAIEYLKASNATAISVTESDVAHDSGMISPTIPI